MSPMSQEKWVVLSRRKITRLAVIPELAPMLAEETRIAITAKCPRGHELPYEVTADEEVVGLCEECGVTIACRECEANFTLDLGNWQ